MAVVDPSRAGVGPANLRGPRDLHVVLHGPRAACVEGVAPSPGAEAYLRDLRGGAFASLVDRTRVVGEALVAGHPPPREVEEGAGRAEGGTQEGLEGGEAFLPVGELGAACRACQAGRVEVG